MLDHVSLAVADYARSRAFYEAALAPLGYRLLMEPVPGVAGFGTERPVFWIGEGHDPGGTTHVAFGTGSRAVVDAFHAAALAAGAQDNGAPGERPIYHPGYYGAYVIDFDQNNVEAVCHGEE